MAERHRAGGDRQQAAGHHGGEDTVPAPSVGNPSHPGARDGRSEHVSEEPGEARCRAGGVLGHEIEGVQPDDHDRPVDQETDGDESRVVDPERPVEIQPVDDDRHERQSGEEHHRGRPTPLEYPVRHPSARDRAWNRGALVQRPRQA